MLPSFIYEETDVEGYHITCYDLYISSYQHDSQEVSAFLKTAEDNPPLEGMLSANG
jgi:hypothetical protein